MRASAQPIIRLGIIICTLITAAVHLSLNAPDPVFILNGLGFLLLLIALLAPIPRLAPYRPQIRWLFIAYTAITVVIWAIIGERTPLGYGTALSEVLLISLLLALFPSR